MKKFASLDRVYGSRIFKSLMSFKNIEIVGIVENPY